MKKRQWHFGATDPVSGIRAYWGPFPTKEAARKAMIRWKKKNRGIRLALKKM